MLQTLSLEKVSTDTVTDYYFLYIMFYQQYLLELSSVCANLIDSNHFRLTKFISQRSEPLPAHLTQSKANSKGSNCSLAHVQV